MSLNPARLVVAVALIAACGDSSTPTAATLSGSWSYAAPSLAATNYAGLCHFSATTLTFTQTGDSIHGTNGATSFICTPSGGAPVTIASVPADLSIVGTISGSTITFTIDGTYWSHTGVFSGNSIAGTVTLTYNLQGTPTTFTGAWTGTRQ